MCLSPQQREIQHSLLLLYYIDKCLPSEKKRKNTTWKRINYKYVQVNSHIYPICIISLYMTWVRISILVLHMFQNSPISVHRTLFRIIISVVRECKRKATLGQCVHNNFLNTLKIPTSLSTALDHRTTLESWHMIKDHSCVLFKSVA